MMPKAKWNLNTIYISERLQESLRPISRCAMTTVVAPMGYGKTTAVNWYLAERAKAEALHIIRISVYSANLAIFWKSTQEAFARAGFPFLRDYPCPTDAAGGGLLVDDLCHALAGDTPCYLDLATGLRRGELLGLKWTDVDFQHGVLKIQRAISRQNGKVVEAPLKTKNAYRTLPLSADAIDVLMQQRRKTGNSEWVFPSPNGNPISPDSVLHMLQRVLKRAGLPRIRFHDLRHTFATMALQNGVDVKTVSTMLGHYSAGFTLDTYAHVTTDAQLKAAQTMGNILSRAV